MYLVSLDLSKNNLLTEQLNVRSFYDLQILNTSLIELQLLSFADLMVDKAYILNCEKAIDFSLFETETIDNEAFNKILYTLRSEDKVVLFRNDVYFEIDSLSLDMDLYSSSVAFVNEYGFCFCVCMNVKELIGLHNRNIDFNELMLNFNKYVDESSVVKGYIKLLGNVKEYKLLLFDILDKKTSFRPPYIAEGVYTEGSVPKGDFSILPPVFLGKNIQIEGGSVVGPYTVIYNNTLVAEESVIKNSVLFNNVFVSSECYIEGSVCCENSSIKRNSAVLSGSVIGSDSLIGEDIILENNSLVRKNVRYDKYIKSPFTNKINSDFKNKFQGLSPDKAALLGSGVASVFNKPKILVASDGSVNSLTVKLAFISGFIASGGECFDIGSTFKSHIFFCSKFCECAFSLYFKGGDSGTDIEIFNNENKPLNNADCCNLFNYCKNREFIFADKNECKRVRQLHGMKRVYIREIVSLFDSGLSFYPIFNCKNDYLRKIIEEIIEKISIKDYSKEKYFIDLNESGTKFSVEYKDKNFNNKEIRKLLHYISKLKIDDDIFGSDVYQNLWKSDAVYRLFVFFRLIEFSGHSLDELFSNLPIFFINSKTISRELSNGEVVKKIADFNGVKYENNRYYIPLNEALVKIVEIPDTKRLKIFSASKNSLISKELCDFFAEYLGGVNT